MKRLLDNYRNAHLQVRLTLPVAATLLVILLACQWVLYAFTADTVNTQLYNSTESAVTRAQSHMDTRLRSIVERLVYIQLDASVEKYLTEYLLSDNSVSEAAAMGQLSHALSLRKATEPLISSLLLYTPKNTFTGDGMPMAAGFEFESSHLWQLLQEQDDLIVFGPAQRDEIFLSHRKVVPIMHRFRIEGYSADCVLVANIDLEKLTAYLLEILPQDESEILLVDQMGMPITLADQPASAALTGDEALLAQALESEQVFDVELAGSDYLLGGCQLGTAPWRLIYLQSKQQVFAQLSYLRNIFALVTLVVVLLLLAALARIVNTVTQPLRKLCERIRLSKNQDALLEFDYPYQNEIGTLAQSYNGMLKRIQHLLQEQEIYIKQLKEEKERADIEQALKRRAELRALQAQINPHFLYNTLDSIRWKAERAGAQDISQMTTALATLFRVGLSRGQEIITVEQEARHVESYLMIQKQRYSDRLSYTVDFQPEVLKLHTVKLILQPLVENAIYHGIKESEHSGSVVITGRRVGDILEMQVSDNGLGIPPERLPVLQADLARGLSVSREGYGIFNVNERIRLHFGAEYGLTLESEWGKGTVATVRLPCITLSEVDKYVSHYDRG